jgi:hypothetical protein
VATSSSEALQRGKAAFDRQAWAEAYAALTSAAEHAPLGPDDLVQLSRAAELIGHDEQADELSARAYQAFLAQDDPTGAARCAIWLGLRLMTFGEPVRAGGWLARAARLLEGVSTTARNEAIC